MSFAELYERKDCAKLVSIGLTIRYGDNLAQKAAQKIEDTRAKVRS